MKHALGPQSVRCQRDSFKIHEGIPVESETVRHGNILGAAENCMQHVCKRSYSPHDNTSATMKFRLTPGRPENAELIYIAFGSSPYLHTSIVLVMVRDPMKLACYLIRGHRART